MFDYKKARKNMVDNLIRPANVTCPRLLIALSQVPRDKFFPSNTPSLAYSETEFSLESGRQIISPWLLAKMIQRLDLKTSDNVLSLASGFGYSCALMSSMANFVVAVENEGIFEETQLRLMENGYDNVLVMEGRLENGANDHGPYDAILIEGSVEFIPDQLINQLKVGGRIVTIFRDKKLGQCRLGVKSQTSIQWKPVFEANCSPLKEFEKEKIFKF